MEERAQHLAGERKQQRGSKLRRGKTGREVAALKGSMARVKERKRQATRGCGNMGCDQDPSCA